MENEALDIRQRNPTALVEWAEKTVKDLESWWHKEWWSHLWMVGVSNGLAVLVPFGLAILLYIPDTLKMKLNVALILCSGVSLILQVIDHALRGKIALLSYAMLTKILDMVWLCTSQVR